MQEGDHGVGAPDEGARDACGQPRRRRPRFGDVALDGSPPLYVTVPAVSAPSAPGDLSWAADASTISLGQTLPGLLAQ